MRWFHQRGRGGDGFSVLRSLQRVAIALLDCTTSELLRFAYSKKTYMAASCLSEGGVSAMLDQMQRGLRKIRSSSHYTHTKARDEAGGVAPVSIVGWLYMMCRVPR